MKKMVLVVVLEGWGGGGVGEGFQELWEIIGERTNRQSQDRQPDTTSSFPRARLWLALVQTPPSPPKKKKQGERRSVNRLHVR